MKRLFFYIPEKTLEEQEKNPRYDSIALATKPKRLFLLYKGRCNPNYVHDSNEPLYHHSNCFIEDIGHDWNWRNGKLTYSPGGERSGGIWIAVEMENFNDSI